MADDIDALLNPKNSAIELYRADFATPETLEAMRFWLQGELNRIQSGFASTDQVVKLLASLIRTVEGTIPETGPQGPQGEKGEAGDSTGRNVYIQATAPAPSDEGDIWIKIRDDDLQQVMRSVSDG